MERKPLWSGLLLAAILAWGCGGDAGVNGGDANIELSAVDQSNVDTSPLPPTDVAVISKDETTGAVLIGVLALEPAGESQRKAWQLTLTLGSEPTQGKAYDLSAGDAVLAYQENPSEGGFREWVATAGSVTVESRSGTSATLAFGPASMAVSIGGTGNAATGTFTLSGKVTVDDLENVAAF